LPSEAPSCAWFDTAAVDRGRCYMSLHACTLFSSSCTWWSFIKASVFLFAFLSFAPKNVASVQQTNRVTSSCYYCHCTLSGCECFREMALSMSVKKLRFYQRLRMNQLKCKSELKCKWEFAVFLIIAFPQAGLPLSFSLSLSLSLSPLHLFTSSTVDEVWCGTTCLCIVQGSVM